MADIIGDKGKRKRRYDPDLARRINEAVRKGEFIEEIKVPSEIADICKGYVEFMHRENRTKLPTDITSRLNPTKDQIEAFSEVLLKYKDLDEFKDITAYYLTALMHSSEDEEFFLDLTKLNKHGILLNYLGNRLKRKELQIIGNVGISVGNVTRDAIVWVHGNAGKNVGEAAYNSKIHLEGTYESLSDMISKGTEVYQHQKEEWVKIYPKK